MLACGSVQAVASTFIFVLFLVVKVPPALSKYNDNLILTLIYTNVWLYFAYTVLAVLGIMGAHVCFTIHLFDIINRNETTKDVLMAIIVPRNALKKASVMMVCCVTIATM